jgi:hypothetical protein
MRLKLQRVDARYARTMPSQYGLFDEVTGKCVGAVAIDRQIGKGASSEPSCLRGATATQTGYRLFVFGKKIKPSNGVTCVGQR